MMQVLDGRFTDYRWVGGRWELDQFKQADGSTNWNEVRAEAGLWQGWWGACMHRVSQVASAAWARQAGCALVSAGVDTGMEP